MQHPTDLFPLQQWWIAGHAEEVGREILPRTLCGKRVVLFRTEAGQAVAMGGICPHRFYPFEKGSLVGDRLRCGYHGLEFDCTGSCSKAPSQSDTPWKTGIASYPVHEAGGLVWIWMGDPEQADPSLLPDLSSIGLAGKGWVVNTSPGVQLKGRYSLLIDNLLDLSHVSFIHADTIPAGEALVHIPSDFIATDRSVNVERIGRNIPSNPFFQMLFPDYSGPVDQHFDTHYLGPCLIRTGGPIYRAGGDELGCLNFIHGITPETATSCHYFVMTARNFAVENSGISQMLLDMGDRIQPQDIDAIEAIEQVLKRSDDLPREISGRADTGGIRVRRLLEKQLADEKK